MAIYNVAYDMNKPGQFYAGLIRELRRLGSFHLQQSVWLVSVTQTAPQLRNVLATYLDPNDTLWISRVFPGNWASYNHDKAAAWLAVRRH